ncbi:MAG TPA: L-aspartate oxidase, partial [Phycisphaerae bacterium]|nr:L-aspartate oxidase [Phycisphaerae bacterium]
MRRHAQVRRYLTAFDTARLPQVFTDVLVIGSGVAALRAALEMAPALHVTLLTKRALTESNSFYAQGGIAAAIVPDDSIESHVADTLATGCGLSDETVVRQVVGAAPGCIRELMDWGAEFDKVGDRISAGREGGHSAPRVIHARGDETGKEITSALLDRVAQSESIDVRDNTYVIDLLVVDGAVVGALAWHAQHGMLVVRARRTVLASGGLGRMYRETTNPEVATGDGLAMAYRAGAVLADLEFVQFHPTTLYIAGASRHLISETVRGEGGRLVDKAGRPFMHAYHPMGDLAPRDMVAAAIDARLRETGDACVYLDARGVERLEERFPTVTEACRRSGVEPTREPIPVVPGAHYSCGGVSTDVHGRTELPGLLAAGEVAR